MSGKKNQETVSNPFSTGGGGTVFEQKIQASLLASLLVRSHVPGFNAAVIHKLHLQAEYLGYETDDVVLFAIDSSGQLRRQLWSVKHDVRFTQKDVVFQDVLCDAWTDFLNSDHFDQNQDAIVVATGPLPVTYKHLLTLLEIIRGTSSFVDFQNKSKCQGFISQEAHEYFLLVIALIEKVTGTNPSALEVWKFLRIFHILGFDFDQAASKDEARFKSLLALAIRAGTGESGENLWNQVFKWVAEGNPRAASFNYENLPEDWRQKANAISVHFESGVVERLSEHSKLTLRRIRSKIGSDYQLPRTKVIGGLAAAFIEQSVTLVSGEAGVGKSVAVWMALQQVAHGAPVFVFQAKEFAYDHLDHALADMRIHESISQISSLFALERRKFILLESVERLLEAPQRDAFADLLMILAEDPTWRIILTCRHYSLNLIKDSFLNFFGIHSYHISIPKLDLGELNIILNKKRDLQKIVKDDRTRYFLCNPWFLDKACLINWSNEAPEHSLNQTQLREALWRQIVIREDATHGGIHRKRDRVFRDIALGRARSMRSFVEPPEGEEAAVQALLADELLVEDMATGFVAPAHDVLEDWALVRWVAQVFDSSENNQLRFFDELGCHLPTRRAYRQWLHESLDGPSYTTIRRFTDVVLSLTDVPNYWRDETVVSLLLSDNSPLFIKEYEDILMSGDKKQLKMIIHMLRLACKKPSPFWKISERLMAENFGDTYLSPDGAAWPAILQITYKNLSQCNSDDLLYLINLLEDWKSGINWQELNPKGTREAGLVALHFWKILKDDYRWEDYFQRLLDVMLKMPQAFPEEFEAMIREEVIDAKEDEDYSCRKRCLDEKLLSFEGCPMICRSHPLLVAEIARKKWHLDGPQKPQFRYGSRIGMNMEPYFGLPASSFKYFPSSAIQGPFWMLLSNHQGIGIKLILDLINITTQRFVESGLDLQFEDPPEEFEFSIDDETNCIQWANERLWLMHRGVKPAPNIIESALMALEKHLLELAKEKNDLRAIAKHIITQSNSIAVTAVIASVSMAYPEAVGDVALIFLRKQSFFELDQARYIHDQGSFIIGDLMLNHTQKIHYRESTESSKLPHRKKDLENFAVELQTGPLKDRVWRIIDEWNQKLQEIEEQSEEIKLLRLRFHRIDIRNFTVKQISDDGRMMFTACEPADDIVQVIAASAPWMKAKKDAAELFVWGRTVFEGRNPDHINLSDWRKMLDRTRHAVEAQQQGEDSEISLYESGSGYVVAVCVKDHWNELSTMEQEWCRDYLLMELNQRGDVRNFNLNDSILTLNNQIPAAKVLPILLDDADEQTAIKIRETIASGLTHASVELREYIALGIGAYLWDRDPELVDCCIGALLDFAEIEMDLHEKWISQEMQSLEDWPDVIRAEVSRIRKLIIDKIAGGISRVPLFDPAKLINLRTLKTISHIISDQLHLPIAHAFYLQVAEYFVAKWKKAYTIENDYRDYAGEGDLKNRLEDFIVQCDKDNSLKIWKPFKENIRFNAKEISNLFEGLVRSEDLFRRGEGFWAIWNETRQTIFTIPNWNKRIWDEDDGLAKLASSLLFDGITWKEEAREWPPLRGHEAEVQEFAIQMATAPAVFKSLIRLLAGIGAFLLPQAFIWLDNVIKKSDTRVLMGNRDELFNLSRMLSTFVFGRTSLISSDQNLRAAVLRILDAMVDHGSSSAYRMRDVLISPTPKLN